MDPLTAIALLAFAAVVAAYGTIIGAGGGFLLIPGLVLFFDLSGVEAVGTGAVTLAAIGIGGARAYDRAGLVDRRGAAWFAAGSVPTALLCGWLLAGRIDRDVFVDLLGVLLLALAVFVVVMPTRFEGEDDRPRRFGVLPVGGAAVGTLSGLFAVGGGLVTLPIVARVLRLGPHRAAATTSATAALGSLAGSTGHTLAGNVVWDDAAVLVVGALIGSTVGARQAGRVPPRAVLVLVAAGLVGAGVPLLLR